MSLLTDQEAEAIRKHTLSRAINALCHRCANGEEREFWYEDRTHTVKLEHSKNIMMIGHASCPANPVWRLMEQK